VEKSAIYLLIVLEQTFIFTSLDVRIFTIIIYPTLSASVVPISAYQMQIRYDLSQHFVHAKLDDKQTRH
jgi:hypothetical protein